MGKQVRYFLTPEDTVELEAELRTIEPLVVLHRRSSIMLPRVLEHLDFEENGNPWLFFYLARPDDLDSIVMNHVASQNYWGIDSLRSPVIEFNRCYFDGVYLRRGRIYLNDKFYGVDDELVEKPAPFRAWANAVLGKTRRSLHKIDGDYFGQEALKLHENGRCQLRDSFIKA